MSLTSHLKDSTSSIHAYLRQTFPNTAPITREIGALWRKASFCAPPNLGVPTRYPYSEVGTSLDYRIRYAFTHTPYTEFVAYKGALNSGYSNTLLQKFFTTLDRWIVEHDCIGQVLSEADEHDLARWCYALALFENIYRQGAVGSPLLEPKKQRDVTGLLNLAPDVALSDLVKLTNIFFQHDTSWLTLPNNLNPTFAGSIDIGGADADLIIDGCLYDIKAASRLNHAAQWTRQIIGYVLLDYEDEHMIHSVGFYFARHSVSISWPLNSFLSQVSNNTVKDIASLRGEFRKLLQNRKLS